MNTTTIAIDVDALTAGDVIDRSAHRLPPLTVLTVEWDRHLVPCVTIDGCRKVGMWVVRWAEGGFSLYADGSTEDVLVEVDDDPADEYVEVRDRYGRKLVHVSLLEVD